MKRAYKKSKKLLQASSLLALALGSPLKAIDFESPADRDTRAVAKQFAAEHPIEQGDPLQLSSYIEYRHIAPDIVDYLPENTRGGLLRSIGMLSNDEFTLEHKLLVNSVFETLQKDQTDFLQLSFNENQIMGRHKLLGRGPIDLTRFFGDADSNYFNTLKVEVNIDDALKKQDILYRLSQSGISHLRLEMSYPFFQEVSYPFFQGKKVDRTEKLSAFFLFGWDRLVALDLAGNGISDAEVIAITKSHTLENLRSLDLTNNKIGDDAVRAIANNPNFAKLESLNLSNNDKIREDAVTAIADSQILKNLLSLNLERTRIGIEGITVIANNPAFEKLQNLNLKFTALSYEEGYDVGKVIANSQILKNLLSLELTFDAIGDNAVIAIANNPTFEKLQSLDVAGNYISSNGIIAIANSQILKNLLRLNLRGNFFGDEGREAIADSSTLAKLQYLDLGYIGFDEAQRNAIKNNPIFANTEIIF